MTISTKRLRERISHLQEWLKGMKQHKHPDNCPNAALYLEGLKAEKQQDIDLLTELLAVREAQPVAWQQNWAGSNWQDCSKEMFDYLSAHPDPIVEIRALFTAPPAVPDDTRRLDWLVAHHVEVRKPLLYGSEKFFTAQTLTDEEDDYHATSLREQIDEAMKNEN